MPFIIGAFWFILTLSLIVHALIGAVILAFGVSLILILIASSGEKQEKIEAIFYIGAVVSSIILVINWLSGNMLFKQFLGFGLFIWFACLLVNNFFQTYTGDKQDAKIEIILSCIFYVFFVIAVSYFILLK